MKGKHWLLAATFRVICSVLLAFGFCSTAAAISFTAISSGICNTTSNGTVHDVNGYCGDAGIDYDQFNNKLVTSVQFVGFPYTPPGIDNLDYIDPATGARSDAAPGFKNNFDELKVATARVAGSACTSQSWPVGTIFTGYTVKNTPVTNIPPDSLPPPGQFVIIERNGALHGPFTLTDPISGFTEDANLRGGFFQDRFCASPNAQGGGDLYIVSGSGDPNADGSASVGGNVWRVTPNSTDPFGTPTIRLLKQIFKPAPRATTHAHLEGVIVVPNDPAKYGPWAGKIVTGDEDRTNLSATAIRNGLNPKIYAIDPNTGTCSQNSNTALSPSCTGSTFAIVGDMPHPEDFDFVEDTFFGVAKNNNDDLGNTGQIVRASGSDFNPTGDILINQEYPQTFGDTTPIPTNACNDVGTNSGLHQILWNGTNFVSTQLIRSPATPLLCQWEHVTFQPVNISITKSPKNATFNIGDTLTFTIVLTSNGPGTARNVKLTDPLPNGNLNWTLASVTPTPSGSCGITSNQLTCNLGDMAPGASFTVVVSTTTGAPTAACNSQKINNTATATARGLPSLQDTGDYTCTPPQIKIVKTPDNATFNIGDTLSFKMVVTNSGGSTAHGVTVSDPLPTPAGITWTIDTGNTTFSSCSIVPASPANPAFNQVLNCGPQSLTAGASVQAAVKTTAGTPAGACTGNKIINTATVTSTDAGNGNDTGDYTCTPTPHITLKKLTNGVDTPSATDGKAPQLVPGTTVTWTYIVTNDGPENLTNVAVSDNQVGPICTVGNLAVGASATCTKTGIVQTLTAQNSVPGVCGGVSQKPLYENMGHATGLGEISKTSVSADYLSHYCNPPSGGKSIQIGPSSMEGAIRISAGDWVNGGYSFKTNFTGPITIAATVTITGACLDANNKKLGTTDTVSVNLGSVAYLAVNGSDWKPTGDANSVLSWQGAVRAPTNLCGGGQLDASKGAVYNATISGTPPGGMVTFRFKYRDPAAKGKPNTNCLNTNDPNRDKADVCGASWSQTVTDP